MALNEKQQTALWAYVKRIRKPERRAFATELVETLEGKRNGAHAGGLTAREAADVVWRVNNISLDNREAA